MFPNYALNMFIFSIVFLNILLIYMNIIFKREILQGLFWSFDSILSSFYLSYGIYSSSYIVSLSFLKIIFHRKVDKRFRGKKFIFNLQKSIDYSFTKFQDSHIFTSTKCRHYAFINIVSQINSSAIFLYHLIVFLNNYNRLTFGKIDSFLGYIIA